MTDHNRPIFPELTRAQWEVLSALTDQRCANLIEGADFISDLSPEAKAFLKGADKKKIESLNANMDFYTTTKAVWRFIWIGLGSLAAFFIAIAQLWDRFGDHFTVKLK